MLPKYAVVVAGGRGQRMGGPVAKQFLEVAGRPLLVHTLERWHQADPTVQLTLVLPADQIDTWHQLAARADCHVPHTVTAGGASRFASVRNGLRGLPDTDGLVAIHDGVRPVVTAGLLARGYALAAARGSAVAAVALKDSLREINGDQSRAVDRTHYQLIQTPQVFRLPLIRRAYEAAPHDRFTDCAAVAEAAAQPIFLFEGSYDNLKVTTAEDLYWAASLLATKKTAG